MDNKTIMVQGTASDVGKSIIATALCRIFSRNKYRVAPFKSWNMSLNSFVTPEGGEIGIAQAIQAWAAGINPTVDMQPVLIKPKGYGLTQVIFRGKAVGDMGYKKDDSYLKEAFKIIKTSLEKLRKANDIVVMEGAGSPVEINVKKWDLANMKIARLFNSPVLLVTDIDRGGALASLVGTLRLLEDEERELVKGLIINRFRGDIDLLKPGIDFLEEYTGKPVLGVIPYFTDFYLPEEDTASLKQFSGSDKKDIEIAVIKLPHLSNFTDFTPLLTERDLYLKYVDYAGDLNNPDLIIIPGSKNTTADLKYLSERGLAQKIIQAGRKGTPVIGICGGYQMMGEKLYDPEYTEGDREEMNGLGLLPIETYFLREKTTHQVKARLTARTELLKGLEGEEIQGYEIHMGKSNYLISGSEKCLFSITSRSNEEVLIADGCVSEDGMHFGTYIHGLFNNDQLRHRLLNNLRINKGLTAIERDNFYNQELITNYDKLADIVEKNLQMDIIYDLLNS